MRYPCIAVLVALFLSAPAHGHSDLPGEGWCANGRPVPLLRLELFPEAIISAREREQQGSCRPGSGDGRECGQFDDDYGTGRRLAMLNCEANSLALPRGGDIGTVVFIAEGPPTFLDEEHHHELYRAEHGLWGACVRCERRTATPPRH